MKAGYHILILSIWESLDFLSNEKFMKNTKHGTFIVVTFDSIAFVQLKIDSQN